MAWRFRGSKYKNAASQFPKQEDRIQDIPVGDLNHSYGNHISSSCVYMAFNADSPSLVTDFDFSPFDDYMLATGSLDNTVKIWLLPEEANMCNMCEAKVVLPSQAEHIGNVLWHPTADGVLAASFGRTVAVFDVCAAGCKFAFKEHDDTVQSLSWHLDGSLMATSSSDQLLRIIDIRNNSVVQKAKCYESPKDTRVFWLGYTYQVLSTGYNQVQQSEGPSVRKLIAADLVCRCILSNSSTPGLPAIELQSRLIKLALMCFFDADTNMLFAAGKGDSSFHFMELTDKSPFLTRNSSESTDLIKGACLVPKRALNLMSAEVARLLLLSHNCITCLPYIVPRKSYNEFHSDLFPETANGEPALTAQQWFVGQDSAVPMVQVQPTGSLIKWERRGFLFSDSKEAPDSKKGNAEMPQSTSSVTIDAIVSSQQPSVTLSDHLLQPSPNGLLHDDQSALSPAREIGQCRHAASTIFKGLRQSKYRFINGAVLHQSTYITNLSSIGKSAVGDSNLFSANSERCAVPLDGSVGVVVVIELVKAGRMGDTVEQMPTLQNGSKVCDLVWDPFDDHRLVTVCENGRINGWIIPPSGLLPGEQLTQPQFILQGHTEKILFACFHPLAKDILMTASYDMTVRLWDLSRKEAEIMQLRGHQDQVLCLAWSPCGRQCVTICKDGRVRLYEPRNSALSVKDGQYDGGCRAARAVWVLNGQCILVSGFDERSVSQQLLLFFVATLSLLSTTELKASPALVIPFYDADACLVYLFAKGEQSVAVLSVFPEPPHIEFEASIELPCQHQGMCFMSRRDLDVRRVEVAHAWRLASNNSIQPVSFSVPRVKMEYFQSDLYPETAVTWEASMTSEQWLNSQDVHPRFVSLQPHDMKPLSEAPTQMSKPQKVANHNFATHKSNEDKKKELLSAIAEKAKLVDASLPQDSFEGVDNDEWDD